MSAEVKMLSGRKWKKTRDKKDSITVKYRCILDATIASGSEGAAISGVPVVGAAHPANNKLEVSSVDYEEESAAGGQKIVTASVTYDPKESSSETIQQQEGDIVYQCDEWGWDSGTEERDLVDEFAIQGAAANPVVNSAGDPFDSSPKVSVPAPVFTKVMKFAARQSGALDFNCKTNDGLTTIGGTSFAIGTLLCSVAEKRIFGDANWNYQYTVQLKFKSNKVKLAGNNAKTECGWDPVVVDAGMRQKDATDATGKRKVLIRMRDQETGQMCTVSSPALLDGNGYAISETDQDQSPRNLRFRAYERATFPGWFYSEPSLVAPTDDEEDDE